MLRCPVCGNVIEHVMTSDRWECTECNWSILIIEDMEEE